MYIKKVLQAVIKASQRAFMAVHIIWRTSLAGTILHGNGCIYTRMPGKKRNICVNNVTFLAYHFVIKF